MQRIVISLTIFLAAPAFADTVRDGAASWSCRNTEAEISCNEGICEFSVADGFTPMDVSLAPGTITVCAYTGCWSGPATILTQGDLLYAQGVGLAWSHDTSAETATFQLALDTGRKLAVLMGEGYAHPMHCEAQG